MFNHEKPTKEKMCLSVSEMSAELGLGLTNCYALIKDPSFYPARRIGRRILIDSVSLRKWLSERNTLEVS